VLMSSTFYRRMKIFSYFKDITSITQLFPDQIKRAKNSGHLTAWLSACYRGLQSGGQATAGTGSSRVPTHLICWSFSNS
jgi:hypothetical protein